MEPQTQRRGEGGSGGGPDATDEATVCFTCGSTALCWIWLAGEDETPHEELACLAHARGHWRAALLTPLATSGTYPSAADATR